LESSLAILKNYESTLLGLRYEDLLHFLINDMLKSGFFSNKNFDNFIILRKNMKINKGLMSMLENEYIQQNKLFKNLN
jgi:hypothetical protein